MSEQLPDPWREVLREAAQASSSEPLVGTQFRAVIRATASKRGLEFPPADEPGLRFIQLLQRYPDVVSILRRPGQDFLVVPAGRSDVLAKGIHRRLYGIRRDVFEAFTLVSREHPYYDKDADRIVWREPEEARETPTSMVPIEPATEAAEVQLRREFVDTLTEDAAARPKLLEALGNPLPLQAFGRAVRAMGLQRDWHGFRTERLLEKIQRWAKEKEIEWKGAWLTEGPTEYTWKNQLTHTKQSSAHDESDPLQALFSGLDAADIQRISIPLDLVLKAISSSRKR